MSQMTKQELEQQAHQVAYNLLLKLIESQPNLVAAVSPHRENGESVGAHLNALYDQLVVLSRKNISGESGVG